MRSISRKRILQASSVIFLIIGIVVTIPWIVSLINWLNNPTSTDSQSINGLFGSIFSFVSAALSLVLSYGQGDKPDVVIDSRPPASISNRGTNISLLTNPAVNLMPFPPEPYKAHPYILTTEFIGRQAELGLIDQWAISSDPVLIIEGIGGLGKSALTWNWLTFRSKMVIPNLAGTIWWSFYETDATVDNFISHAIAYITRTSVEQVQSTSRHERLAALLNLLEKQPYLIILDGVERLLIQYNSLNFAQLDDEEVGAASHETGKLLRTCTDPNDANFLRAISQSAPTKILISTRLMPADLQSTAHQLLPGVKVKQLDGLDSEDALSLIKNLGVIGDADIMKAFMAQFENHSLTINVIAGIINEYGPSRGNFNRWYQDIGRKLNVVTLNLRQRHTHILKYVFEGLDDQNALLLSWIAAFRYPVSRETIAILNPYLPSRPVWFPEPFGKWIYTLKIIFYNASSDRAREDQQHFETIVNELMERRLLQWDQDHDRYDLHPLVRSFAFEQLHGSYHAEVFDRIHDYFVEFPPKPKEQIMSIGDLQPELETYYSLINGHQLDAAAKFYLNRLHNEIYIYLANEKTPQTLLKPLFQDDFRNLPKIFWRSRLHKLIIYASNLLEMSDSLESRKLSLFLKIRSLVFYLKPFSIGSFWIRLQGFIGHLWNWVPSFSKPYYQSIVDCLGIIARSYEHTNRLTLSSRFYDLANELAKTINYKAPSFQKDMYRFLVDTNNLGSGKDLAQQIYQRHFFMNEFELADLEYAHALSLFYRGQSATAALNEAWIYADRGFNRWRQVWIQYLRGDIAFQEGQLDTAIYFYSEGVKLKQSQERDARQDFARLALAYSFQGNVLEAKRLISEVEAVVDRHPYYFPYNTIAQIYVKLGETQKATEYAINAYKTAWSDGPPYCWYWKLEEAKKTLDSLNVTYPPMPAYNPAKIEPFKYNHQIQKLIQKSQRKYTVSENIFWLILVILINIGLFSIPLIGIYLILRLIFRGG